MMDDPQQGQSVAFQFACPACQSPLHPYGEAGFQCPQEDLVFRKKEGVWRFLLPERLDYFGPFIRDYQTIRQAEGRGMEDPTYFQSLPFQDLSGRFSDDWRIRATSYRHLLSKVVGPFRQARNGVLRILDLGSGNGWLANRLAQHGHLVMAIDLQDDPLDGLGAHHYYATQFASVQAEFDRLPLVESQADLVIFNGTIHYSEHYRKTLGESLRVLAPDGKIVILDTPVYYDPQSGVEMVRERQSDFKRRYGTRSDALQMENYLTYTRLRTLAQKMSIQWRFIRPFYNLGWALRPWKARLRGHREPARFLIIEGTRT